MPYWLGFFFFGDNNLLNVRYRNPRCVGMVLVICMFVQLVDIFVPQMANLEEQSEIVVNYFIKYTRPSRCMYTSMRRSGNLPLRKL